MKVLRPFDEGLQDERNQIRKQCTSCAFHFVGETSGSVPFSRQNEKAAAQELRPFTRSNEIRRQHSRAYATPSRGRQYLNQKVQDLPAPARSRVASRCQARNPKLA